MKINKPIIIIISLISIILISIGSSYALFQKTIVKDDFVKLETGTTDITTTIENYSDNLITLASGESKTLNIILSNITNYDILYQMYYTVESGNGTITTTELSSDPKGTMNNNKTLSITIQNNNTSEITIKVATKGALINSNITLEDGEYEFLTDITPPTVTVSAVDNNTISPKLSITSNEDGTYCVNTSSTTIDISNCVFSGNITADTQIITDAFTTANAYYVHVKDTAGNIGISSKVAIILISLTADTFATEKYGTGGLVAINTDGTLYNDGDTTQTIREYRYSGASVNNYITFNDETWRIVGVFQNSSGEWNLKLMRNTTLTSAELPSTYTYDGTSHTIEYSTSGTAYWNYTNTATNYNDWTTAGLQYYLNGTDGYFGTLSNGAQVLVDTNYVYYLGNVSATNYSEDENDTAITAYENERKSTVCGSGITNDAHTNNCDIWYGNKATWNSGKGIALLYPSDYGYSADSSYWNTIILWDYNEGPQDTSWMYTTANHTGTEWMLSPSSYHRQGAAAWSGAVSLIIVHVSRYGIRPVLNLLASAPIDSNHQGTESDPYVVIGS